MSDNKPEWWRINMAAEKVIIMHEYRILEEKCDKLVKDNQWMAYPCIAQVAAFAAHVAARLRKIAEDGRNDEAKIPV